MAVKNYTKTILIRAREEEARSWALRASEGGKRLSTWIREALNERAGYEPDGLSPESVPPGPSVEFTPVIIGVEPKHSSGASTGKTTPSLTDEMKELLDREFNQ